MKTTQTRFGDRWDLIAYDLLGSAALAPALMAANPQFISLTDGTLPEGAEITLPEISAETEQITRVKAPWKD